MAIAHIIDHSHNVPATDIIYLPQDAPSNDSRTSEEADEVSEDPMGQNKEVEATETTAVSPGAAPATKTDAAELLVEIRQVQKQMVVVTELLNGQYSIKYDEQFISTNYQSDLKSKEAV
jgi:hypothetical protein